MVCKYSKSCAYYLNNCYLCEHSTSKCNCANHKLSTFSQKVSKTLLISLTFIFLVLTINFVSGIGTYPSTCGGLYSWMQNSSVVAINNTKLVKFPDISLFFENNSRILTWQRTASASYPGENLTTFNDSFLGLSLNFTYNITAGGVGYRAVKNYFSSNVDMRNYSGFYAYIRGDSDSSNVYIGEIKLRTNGTGTIRDNFITIYNYGSVGNTRLYLNSTWKLVYFDFGMVRNVSQSTVYLPGSETSAVLGMQITFWNATSFPGLGHFYLANVTFVDYDHGNSYYPRWRDKTDMRLNSRYAENIYEFAYLYNKTANVDYLNYSLAVGDMMVRYQLVDGSWQNVAYQTTGSYASSSFPAIPFIKSFLLLRNDFRMQENISIYSIVNGSFMPIMTRFKYWNNTLDAYKKWGLTKKIPLNASDVFNQYIGHLHSMYLYCNYVGDSACLAAVDGNLTFLTNVYELNTFGFGIEKDNRTDNKIGYSNEYTGFVLGQLSSFYFDYPSPIIKGIILKMDNLSVHRFNSCDSYFENSSRGLTTSYEGNYIQLFAFSKLFNVVNFLQVIYNKVNSILPTVPQDETSIETYQGNFWRISSYEQCNPLDYDNQVSLGIRFPQNYSYFVYNTKNISNVFVRKALLGSGGFISDITQQEFPQIVAFWDGSWSFVTSSNNLDVSGSISSIRFFANELTNITFNNLTSALLTNSTSLCNGSSGLTTGNINITLNPNEYAYVLDNFNITTGRYRTPVYDNGLITGVSGVTLPVYSFDSSVNSNLTMSLTTQINLTYDSNSTIHFKPINAGTGYQISDSTGNKVIAGSGSSLAGIIIQ